MVVGRPHDELQAGLKRILCGESSPVCFCLHAHAHEYSGRACHSASTGHKSWTRSWLLGRLGCDVQPRGRKTRGYEACVIAGEGQRAECMDVASHEPGKALSPATASAACATVAWELRLPCNLEAVTMMMMMMMVMSLRRACEYASARVQK